MVISTGDKFRYEFIPSPRNQEAIVFEAQAGSGLHIALSELRDVSSKMYQVVVGDLDNTVSWIGRGKHGKLFSQSDNYFHTFIMNEFDCDFYLQVTLFIC